MTGRRWARALTAARETMECCAAVYGPGEWHPRCEVVRINEAPDFDHCFWIDAPTREDAHRYAASLALDGAPSTGRYLSPPMVRVNR